MFTAKNDKFIIKYKTAQKIIFQLGKIAIYDTQKSICKKNNVRESKTINFVKSYTLMMK